MTASAVDRRARVQRLRAGLIRRLPGPLADLLRAVTRPFRASAHQPHEMANLQATVLGAMATNEAGIVGLSQELARLSRRVDELAERIDDLSAERRAGDPSPPT